uniref:RGS domain-containing protein n=1 Tax=Bicosoecida sp. CB-2014 TaxID=1486930 RepID=A0A7S1GCY0_9STRA
MFVARRRYHPLKSRSKVLVLLMSSCALVLAVLRTGVVEFMGPSNAPCDMQFFSGMLFPLFAGPPALVRLMRLHQLYLLNRRKQKISAKELAGVIEMGRLRSRSSTFFLTLVLIVSITPSLLAITVIYVEDRNLGKGCVNCPLTIGNLSINLLQGIAYFIVFSVLIYKTRHMYDAFHVRRELVHWTLMWALLILLVSPFMTVSALVEAQHEGWFDGSVFFLVGAIGTQIISVVLPTLGTYNRGPYSGYVLELQSNAALQSVRARTASSLTSGWRKGRGPVGHDTLNPLSAQMEGNHGVTAREVSSVALGDEAAAAAVADSSGASEGSTTSVRFGELRDPEAELCELLRDPQGIKAFTAHLTTEFSVENIRFWMDVEAYKAQFDELAPEERAARAGVLYETYITQNSPLMINIRSRAAREITTAVKGEGAGVSATTFDAAQAEIFKLMAQDSYRRFLRSPLFASFLKYVESGGTEVPAAEAPRSLCVRLWLAFYGRAVDEADPAARGPASGVARSKDTHAVELTEKARRPTMRDSRSSRALFTSIREAEGGSHA